MLTDALASAPIAIVGNLNVDQVIRTVDRFPRWDEELIVDSARIEFAGTAGYMLLAARGLGMDAFAVSTIGDDPFGAFLQAGLRDLGFDASGVEVLPGRETCLGIIFVGPRGQRGIFAMLGAHAEMDLAVVQRHDDRVAACAEVILCGSYLLPRLGPSSILPYARALRARGQLVVFDPSWDPGGWSETTRQGTFDLLTAVDVYMPNETELLHLTGAPDLDAALAIVARPGGAGEVVVKRGAEGATFASRGIRVDVPGYPVDAVSTIGAGDVFDLGYLHARRRGLPPKERLRFACAVAALVVSQTGARVYPDRDAVARFMEERTHAGHHAA